MHGRSRMVIGPHIPIRYTAGAEDVGFSRTGQALLCTNVRSGGLCGGIHRKRTAVGKLIRTKVYSSATAVSQSL